MEPHAIFKSLGLGKASLEPLPSANRLKMKWRSIHTYYEKLFS